jgi:hypothetical protein
MADYTPIHNPGNEISFTASAPVVGGQVVVVTGVNSVGPAGADANKVVGVAAFDAAAGARVTVFVKAFVHETPSTGTIAAGDFLATGANGVVATQGAAVNRVGIALTAATGGAVVRWLQK